MKNFILFMSMLVLIACSKNEENQSLHSAQAKKKLVILALDKSLSFKRGDIKPEHIRQLCKGLEMSGSEATVLIYPLGNPSTNPKLISCHLEGFEANPNTMTLSQKREAVMKKRKLTKLNDERISAFISAYEDQIFSKPKTMHTDIRSFNRWLYILSREDRYSDYHKTLLLYSDGINSIAGRDGYYPLEKKIPNLSIYTCGLSQSAYPFKQQYKEVTNPETFFNQFKI